MRYAKIKYNDVANAPGVSVSLYVQGCPHRCPGCFNPETWNFDGGYEFTEDTIKEIIDALGKNGITRSLSLLGGEPLCPANIEGIMELIYQCRKVYPELKIWVWTGYTLEELQAMEFSSLDWILEVIDGLVDGPYVESERDISLDHRGSRNQRVLYPLKKYLTK